MKERCLDTCIKLRVQRDVWGEEWRDGEGEVRGREGEVERERKRVGVSTKSVIWIHSNRETVQRYSMKMLAS